MKIWSGLDINKNEISKDLKPSDTNLADVLEKDVKDLVIFFVKKNFKTISSCSGHSIYESAKITFVVPSLQTFYFFKKKFKSFFGIEIIIRDYKNFGNVKNTRLGPSKFIPSIDYFNYKMSLFTNTCWNKYYPVEIIFGYDIFPETKNKLILCFYNIFLKKIVMFLFLLYLKVNLKNFDFYIKY